jgi:Uma2 family endonuclease
MAAAPTLPRLSVDEYLKSSWRPDREYVDGRLVERSAPTYVHSLLQALLIAHFRQFEQACHFKTLPELRTEIVERARYRIPDLLLCATPTKIHRIMNEMPLAIIEILSPGDTVTETLRRFGDYARIGVPHIVQMDPESQVAHRFEQGSLIRTIFDGLHFEHTTIPFNSAEMFAAMRREAGEAAGE